MSGRRLREAVFLKGSSVTELSEADEKGNKLGSSEVFLKDRLYYDRINNEVASTEHRFSDDTRNITKFNLECLVDAITNEGF